MLQDKVIVITGGAGLLGRSFARQIVDHGGTAVLADINFAAATAAAAQIATPVRGKVEAAALDITDKDSICSLIGALKAHHGRIDAVVNNAYPRNKNYGRKLEDVTYTDFCDNVSSHLGGYFLTAQQFGLFFRKQGAGNIVNMASIYGAMAPRFKVYAETSMTMPVEYAAIKSAVIHLTKYFAQYFKGHGVRVNCLSPGGILDRQPEEFLRKYNAYGNVKGMLDPSDVAGVLMFLLSDASQLMTGQNLLVDDGWSL